MVVGAWDVVMALIALERIAELVLTRRNAAWSFARGGIERGQGHWPVMVALHIAFFVGCVVEPHLAPRDQPGWVTAAALTVAVAAQALRWWVIGTLGPRWNARVIVVPGLPRVEGGPFRWLRHPNYLAVVTEGIALPLAGGAWGTAVTFTILNALLLRVRIRTEEEALALL